VKKRFQKKNFLNNFQLIYLFYSVSESSIKMFTVGLELIHNAIRLLIFTKKNILKYEHGVKFISFTICVYVQQTNKKGFLISYYFTNKNIPNSNNGTSSDVGESLLL